MLIHIINTSTPIKQFANLCKRQKDLDHFRRCTTKIITKSTTSIFGFESSEDCANFNNKILKVIKISNEDDLKQLNTEIEIGNQVHGLPHLFGFPKKSCFFEHDLSDTNTSKYPFFVLILMERMKSDMSRTIATLPKNTRDLHVLLITSQIFKGLEKIHKLKIIHLDLKPDNIFMRNEYEALVADFGLSQKGVPSQTEQCDLIFKSKLCFGTIPYTTPEHTKFICSESFYTDKTDVYTLGLIIIRMFRSNYQIPAAISAKDLSEVLMRSVIRTQIEINQLLTENPNHLTSEFERLFSKMLDNDYNKRPGISEAYKMFIECVEHFVEGYDNYINEEQGLITTIELFLDEMMDSQSNFYTERNDTAKFLLNNKDFLQIYWNRVSNEDKRDFLKKYPLLEHLNTKKSLFDILSGAFDWSKQTSNKETDKANHMIT